MLNGLELLCLVHCPVHVGRMKQAGDAGWPVAAVVEAPVHVQCVNGGDGVSRPWQPVRMLIES